MIKIVPVVLAGLLLAATPGIAKNHHDGVTKTDTSFTIEYWMFDANYLTAETLTLESWMMDENWLAAPVEAAPIESWMTDEDYLASEPQVIESWMTDAGYLAPEKR